MDGKSKLIRQLRTILVKNGISVNPSSGRGNTIQEYKLETPNLGNRLVVPVEFQYTTNELPPKTLVANIVAMEEFVNWNDGLSVAADVTGGNLTLNLTTNSESLTFESIPGTEEDRFEVIIPDNYLAAGSSTENGVDIIGDPGAQEAFAASITFNIPEWTELNDRFAEVRVVTKGGNPKVIRIVQSVTPPFINIPDSIDINQDGSATIVNITSNVNFTVI